MQKNNLVKPELLAPAGDLERLKMAFLYGADAVYCGVPQYGMRVKEIGFDLKSLAKGIEYAHDLGKKIYVTVNIFAHNDDLVGVKKFLKKLNLLAPDALIVADPGILQIIKEEKIKIPIHISTQANITNWQAVKYWLKQGADQLVLARELSQKEIKEINYKVPKAKLEMFVHGALCMSISGRCHISNYFNQRDANRGKCSHCCRWEYDVYLEEKTRPGEMMLVEQDERGSYFFNSKDLCLIDCLDQVLDTGVVSLKIEGRNKTEAYVATVVQSYRQALDLLWDDKKNYQVKKGEFIERLRAVETRGFTHGFFKKKQEDISNYRERTGLGNRQYVGKVLGRVGEMVEILAKNQIRLSDSLDVLSPKIIRKITINRFMDKKGNDLGEVVNTNDIFYFVTDLDLRPGDLLRKIITK